MGSFGGYYKGDKKKPKKGEKGRIGAIDAPVMQMPEIISKKKKDY